MLEYLDINKDGFVNFDEFLVQIRGRCNEIRQKYIDLAFTKFDKDESGTITAEDLRVVYDCSTHPKVKSGKMTKDEVY